MYIVGVDYHPSFQQIAFLNQETGECGDRRLNHSDGEAERFYRELRQKGISVRVGLEATGYSRWFERLLGELEIEVWIGSRGDQSQARPQAKDRPSGCPVVTKVARGKSFSSLWGPHPRE